MSRPLGSVDRQPRKRDRRKLTPRELEVLALLATGLMNKEIADRLGITNMTTKNHVNNILQKMNVGNRTEAAIMYLTIRGL